MEILTKKLGRILFALPFAIFGINHLLMADAMVGIVPAFIPFGIFWVYLIGLCQIAASIAIMVNYLARAASFGLAIMLATFVLTIHLPGILGDNMQMAMVSFLKDFALMGAALMTAGITRNFPAKPQA